MTGLLEVMRSEQIATKWYDLGSELLGGGSMKVIEIDHRNDANTCCRVMFEKWLEKTPNASWSHLVTALNKIEMKTAANAISKRYKSGE